jgi:hypothetical protein
MSFVRDLRVAAHSLIRTPGLSIAVVLTLALGIGANAAIFTLVRGVLLKPLVNRGEDRLIYIRQSAPGIGDENSTFSVPEIQDLRRRQLFRGDGPSSRARSPHWASGRRSPGCRRRGSHLPFLDNRFSQGSFGPGKDGTAG